MPFEIRFGPPSLYDNIPEHAMFQDYLDRRHVQRELGLAGYEHMLSQQAAMNLLGARETYNQQFLNQRQDLQRELAGQREQGIQSRFDQRENPAAVGERESARAKARLDAQSQMIQKNVDYRKNAMKQHMADLAQHDPAIAQILQTDPNLEAPELWMRSGIPQNNARLQNYASVVNSLNAKQAGIKPAPLPETLPEKIQGDLSWTDEQGQEHHDKIPPGMMVHRDANGSLKVTPLPRTQDWMDHQRHQREMQAIDVKEWSEHNAEIDRQNKEDTKQTAEAHKQQEAAWQRHYDSEYEQIVSADKMEKDEKKKRPLAELQAEAQKKTEQYYGPRPIYKAPTPATRLPFEQWKAQFRPQDTGVAPAVPQSATPGTPLQPAPAAPMPTSNRPVVANPGVAAQFGQENPGFFPQTPPAAPAQPTAHDLAEAQRARDYMLGNEVAQQHSRVDPLEIPDHPTQLQEGMTYQKNGKRYLYKGGKFWADDEVNKVQ